MDWAVFVNNVYLFANFRLRILPGFSDTFVGTEQSPIMQLTYICAYFNYKDQTDLPEVAIEVKCNSLM
jgi:hypothetical protein